MYTHPWWFYWRSQKNSFLQMVLAAHWQHACVIPRLDHIKSQTVGKLSWAKIAHLMGWDEAQMERVRAQTDNSKRKAGHFEVVKDKTFSPKTGGLSFGVLADLSRFFGVEVSDFIPPLSVHYTGATQLFIEKAIEESGGDLSLLREFPPQGDIWAYAQYYIALRWKDPVQLTDEMDQEAVAEVLSNDGNDVYFDLAKCTPFGFENEDDVEAAILRTRATLDNLLAWLEARDLFSPRWD